MNINELKSFIEDRLKAFTPAHIRKDEYSIGKHYAYVDIIQQIEQNDDPLKDIPEVVSADMAEGESKSGCVSFNTKLHNRVKELEAQLASLKPKRVLWEPQEVKEGVYLEDVEDGVITGHTIRGNVLCTAYRKEKFHWQGGGMGTNMVPVKGFGELDEVIEYLDESYTVGYWLYNGQPLHLEPKPKQEEGIYWEDVPYGAILAAMNTHEDIEYVMVSSDEGDKRIFYSGETEDSSFRFLSNLYT